MNSKRRSTDSMDAREELERRLENQPGIEAEDDAERRRMILAIYDKTSPALVGIITRLHLLKQFTSGLDETATTVLHESLALAEDVERQFQSLAVGLQPRVLEHAGLVAAICWYVASFTKRTGVPVELDLPPEFPRLPTAIEAKMFRIVEDVLSEIDLHSRSKVADIRLISTSTEHRLAITDKAGEVAGEYRVSHINKSSVEMRLIGPTE